MLCLLSKERKNIYISCNYYHSISPYIHISPSHILHSPTAFGAILAQHLSQSKQGTEIWNEEKTSRCPRSTWKEQTEDCHDAWHDMAGFHDFLVATQILCAGKKNGVFFFWGGGPSWETFKGEWCVFFWLFFWWGWFCFGVMFQRMWWLLGGQEVWFMYRFTWQHLITLRITGPISNPIFVEGKSTLFWRTLWVQLEVAWILMEIEGQLAPQCHPPPRKHKHTKT